MGGGCVISASYEAKSKGVKTGMPLKEALELVPDALQCHSDFQETGLASQQIETTLRDVCPLIEQMSIDEWFLDLKTVPGGVPKNLATFAKNIRSEVLSATGISVSVGIAPSKLLAKMASEYRKPAGVTVVSIDETAEDDVIVGLKHFLQDRPAAAIPGIGRRRQRHTDAEGWDTAWDIAMANTQTLIKYCGRPGEEMQQELKGIPVHPVVEDTGPPKSISRCRSFRREVNPRILWAHALRHLEYLVLKLRRHGLACRGVSLWMRDSEYLYNGTHFSLPQPMDTEEALQPYLRKCMRKLYQKRKSYTQIGMAIWRLEPKGAVQYSLFEEPTVEDKRESVQKSLDTIHTRFGRQSLTRASALPVKTGTKRGLNIPLYESGLK
jgi:nucleotidyltransferase/DNA polymerase involved in DNA repair